jgi:hypothetical protein
MAFISQFGIAEFLHELDFGTARRSEERKPRAGHRRKRLRKMDRRGRRVHSE